MKVLSFLCVAGVIKQSVVHVHACACETHLGCAAGLCLEHSLVYSSRSIGSSANSNIEQQTDSGRAMASRTIRERVKHIHRLRKTALDTTDISRNAHSLLVSILYFPFVLPPVCGRIACIQSKSTDEISSSSSSSITLSRHRQPKRRKLRHEWGAGEASAHDEAGKTHARSPI
jgi:hypothetical protein